MADRRIVYAGQVPLETDLLFGERAGVEGLGRLAMALFGGNTVVDGLTVAPTSPASLAVTVSPGCIFSALPLDASAYSSLPADTRTVIQQGILRDPVNLTITPPTTSGQSRVYLVQATCQVTDTDPTVLPYYNAANPDMAFTGPDNSGTPQNTTRAVRAVIGLKAGVAAATGSQVTPAPDAGYTGLYAITVATGAVTVTAGNIVALAGAPYIRYPIQTLRPGMSNGVIFATSTSWTVPSGVTRVLVRVWGAGGGGGASAGPGAATGGGGGGFAEGYFNVTPGDAISVVVGIGGAGAGVTSVPGFAGGSSAFGAYISGTGGFGGDSNPTPNAAVASGGNAGIGSGGHLQLAGAGGVGGLSLGSGIYLGGGGGAAALMPTNASYGGTGGPGAAGYLVGGGGVGGSSNVGGKGGNGLVEVRY